MKNEKIKLYAIPGLGLNAKIFDHLDIDDVDIVILEHINPLKEESLSDYLDRMLQTYEIDSLEGAYIMGHSFGGIMAQELSMRHDVKGIVLVSTIINRAELPPYLAVLDKVRLHKILRKEMITKTYWIWGEQDGYNTHEERQIFMDMTEQFSDYYYQWAITQVVSWHPSGELTVPRLRIHGSKDKTFPALLTKYVDHMIKNGSHVMVKSMASTVSQLVSDFVKRGQESL